MPCIRSRPAWSATNANENGKHNIRFKPPKLSPDAQPDYYISCGKCLGCVKQRRRDWGIRMHHESLMHEQNSFITLTYDDQHCPININRHDPQTFLKRLRNRVEKPRYFLTGEYGSKTARPHYHAIIFGHDFLGGAHDIGNGMYINEHLTSIWGKGNVVVAPFTVATAMYTAGYVTKKLDDSDTFSIMSRYPPIGKEWVRANHDNIRRMESVQIEGTPYPVPKVYMTWLEGVEEFDKIKENQRQSNPLDNQQARSMGINLASADNARQQKEKH